jgi:hypothetical protein
MLIPLPGIALVPSIAVLAPMSGAQASDFLRVVTLAFIKSRWPFLPSVVLSGSGLVHRVPMVMLDRPDDSASLLSGMSTTRLSQSSKPKGHPASTLPAISEWLTIEREVSQIMPRVDRIQSLVSPFAPLGEFGF